MCFKSCPKSNHNNFYLKSEVFQNSFERSLSFGICHQDVSKIAQSGHTGRNKQIKMISYAEIVVQDEQK